MLEFFFTWLIVLLIYCCIWGAVCNAIVSSKNYPPERNHGFAWGFWLGLIGLIVCACKPNYFETYEGRQNIPNNSMSYDARKLDPYNANFATEEMVICACGARIRRTDKFCTICGRPNQNNQLYSPHNSAKPQNDPDLIVKYKKMLDDGLITEEELNAKKKQILGL